MTMDAAAPGPRFPGRLFTSVFAVLFAIMAAWSLATPIYAVSDEASTRHVRSGTRRRPGSGTG